MPPDTQVHFAEFTVDPITRQLLRGPDDLRLEPKAFALLSLLLEHRPRAVSKNDIQARLWPDAPVSEGSLTSLVAQIRLALQDERTQPRFIRTVRGFGYAFCAEASSNAHAAAPSPCSVVWGRRVLPMFEGENLLGRAEDASVRIEGRGVSRQHARIRVSGPAAVLEDLGSKNGTHLGGHPLDGPVELADGDVFHLGSQALVFRRSPTYGTTDTFPVPERD